jgi:ubiquinone/menaquinone biosynthesis C-methylase UbiE
VGTQPKPSGIGEGDDRSLANLQRFDEVADHPEFADVALKPAERNALVLLADHLPEVEMLDLGIGAGRTGYTFAPLVRRYVGLDFSARLIAHAQRRLGADGNIELLVGDARDLSIVEGSVDYMGFDFVLFSFNGIDAVGHEDRRKILSGVRRVIKPHGRFLFSSHSMTALPLSEKRPTPAGMDGSRVYRLVSPLARWRYARKARESNQLLDLEAARERGWIQVRDPAFDFSIDAYYVDPARQVEELRELGFSVEAIYNVAGEQVQLPYAGDDPWLDYLCRPVGDDELD